MHLLSRYNLAGVARFLSFMQLTSWGTLRCLDRLTHISHNALGARVSSVAEQVVTFSARTQSAWSTGLSALGSHQMNLIVHAPRGCVCLCYSVPGHHCALTQFIAHNGREVRNHNMQCAASVCRDQMCD